MVEVILSLGTNVGEREKNLFAAIAKLKAHKEIEILNISSIYKTSPVGVNDQSDFYNLCLSLRTEMEVKTFHRFTKQIEEEVSRPTQLPQKEINKGPRVIDIDIILFGDLVVADETLQIPHRDYSKRLFVLTPLLEIVPNRVEPKTQVPIKNYLDQNDFKDQVITKF